MAKRVSMSAAEARAYLADERYPGAATLSDDYAKRIASGLKRGKAVAVSRGHGTGEHHYERATPVVYQQTKTRSVVTEFRVGKAPDENLDPDKQTAGAPQPRDLIRLVKGYTKSKLINVGITGYLLIYLNPDEEVNSYVGMHTWVERDWFLARLLALPQDHYYQANDPAYLALAHDCVSVAQNKINGQAGGDTWQWGWVYQWSVRDMR